MQQFPRDTLKDTLGLGTLLWLIGYLASMALYFSPLSYTLGWVILVIFTPFTIWITWWWFKARALSISWYAGVGISWTAIAVMLDYIFIVLLFHSPDYYAMDVFICYALMFFIPVGVGAYLRHAGRR
jgi:hypothetical protein